MTPALLIAALLLTAPAHAQGLGEIRGVLVDHVEIPDLNHFPAQGASGSPIGLLNTDIIEDVAFYTGGFSAACGGRPESRRRSPLPACPRQGIPEEVPTMGRHPDPSSIVEL